MTDPLRLLYKAATEPFIESGRHSWYFARGKLRRDPVFFGMLKHGVLPDQGRLLDLGCGQGILLSLLVAARKQFKTGIWPQGWPAPPSKLTMRGVELRTDCVRTAQRALRGSAGVEIGDIREVNFAGNSVITLLDVLHYLDNDAQRCLLERIAASLESDGVFLMRETDAGAGIRFHVTHWAERIGGMQRGLLWRKLYFRSTQQWVRLLEEFGFTVSLIPMSEGTPFSNVLFVATRRLGE